jgi:hypothetical protein
MSRIDDFEILAKLGEGGMGTVFKAHQVSLGRVVALKVLAPKLAKEPALVGRFLREARATAKLNHPNIVAGIAVGSEAGYHYFAMEMIEGETFKKRIQASGLLPEAEVLRVGVAMASALAHAHAAGIVHRDVKPDNILIDRDGTPKLADLGLAKAESAEDASLTQSGMTLGTPHYMAPEQAAGESNIDGRADTYALGCTLYHAATGKTPFEAPSMGLLMVKHINDRMPHPQSIRPELSDAFCLILSRMVARDRQDRYANLNEAAADMEGVLAGNAPKCTPVPAAKSKFTAAPVPAQGVTKGERMATRRHAPVEGERMPSRRHAGVEGGHESKRRIAVAPKKSAMPMAIAGGAVLFVGVLFFAMSGGSKPAADEKKSALTQAPNVPPKPATLVATSPSIEHPPTAQPTPESRPTEKQPIAPQQPRPAIAVETPPPAQPTIKVASSDPPPSNVPSPSNGGGTSLFNGRDLSDWHSQGKGQWKWENGAAVGIAGDGNASIWKYGCLPLDFDLTFTAEDGDQGCHFGWTAKEKTVFIQFEPEGVVRITDYITDAVEVKRASANYSHGKHAWRLIAKQSSVKVFIDGALAVESSNIDQAWDRNRDICFFARSHSTLRISQLCVRDPSSAPAEAAVASATDTQVEAQATNLPPEELLKHLTEKLKAANPGFDGQLVPKIEDGKIVELKASPAGLKDLSPFRMLPALKRLILNSEQTTPLSDLGPLKGMQLTQLEILHSSVRDLSPLAGMSLTHLNIAATQVSDISPLQGMPLIHLSLQCSHVTDFSPLRGMPLKTLYCYAIQGFRDLHTLHGLSLEYFDCSYNPAITDLSPVLDMPLKTLFVDHTGVEDLSGLKKLKLKLIRLNYKPGVHDELLRGMPDLENINGMPAAEFWTRAAKGTLPK